MSTSMFPKHYHLIEDIWKLYQFIGWSSCKRGSLINEKYYLKRTSSSFYLKTVYTT